MKDFEWSAAQQPEFAFQVADTTLLYNVFFVFRHHDAFYFNNVHVDISQKSSVDSAVVRTYNFRLGDGGKWLGKTMQDAVEHRIRINQKPLKMHAGTYYFTLKHRMRQDPLLHVLHTGIRIEKSSN